VPCEISLQENDALALIRVKARLKDAQHGGTVADENVDRVVLALRGDAFVPVPESFNADLLAREREQLRAELTGDCQAELKLRDVAATQLTFERGSIEILLLIAATAKIVQDYGAIAQGLREIAKLVPDRVKDFVERWARSSLFDQSVEMEYVETRVEMQGGLLTPTMGRAAEAPPAAENRFRDQATAISQPPRADGRLITYLITSHAILTLVLIAAGLVLLAERI
jgi:hypothetical protein